MKSILVKYFNNQDERHTIHIFESIDKLKEFMIEELNEFCSSDPEEVTNLEDIKEQNNIYYSSKWGMHHTWKIIGFVQNNQKFYNPGEKNGR